MKIYVIKGMKKRGRKFSSSLNILFFTERIIYCVPHNIQGFSDLYVPTTITEQPIPSVIFPFPCGFLPHLPFSFQCHFKLSFLKREGGFFLPSLLCYFALLLSRLSSPMSTFPFIPPERLHWNLRDSNKPVGLFDGFLSVLHFFPATLLVVLMAFFATLVTSCLTSSCFAACASCGASCLTSCAVSVCLSRR